MSAPVPIAALTRADTAAKRLDDGLPESLQEAIAAYGHRYFKLKVGGSIDADIKRLASIAAVLDSIAQPYFVTLDGNEQFEHIDTVIELWQRIGEDTRFARLKAAMWRAEADSRPALERLLAELEAESERTATT